MRPMSALASTLALVLTISAGSSGAQVSAPGPTPYVLVSPPSELEWGCFDPCACPILVHAPLTGHFVLRYSHADPLNTYYDVTDVNWTVPGPSQPITITGSGVYRRGGQVAVLEQLTLDLSIDGGAPRRFDSGLRSPGAPFPELRTRISLHGEFCRDSVLVVGAKPNQVLETQAGVPRPLSLVVGPNPFRGSADISFGLPRDGVVDLAVYDVAGRHVATVAQHEWLTAGEHRRAWEGRRASGLAAPVGLYLVRLTTTSGQVQRTLVKL